MEPFDFVEQLESSILAIEKEIARKEIKLGTEQEQEILRKAQDLVDTIQRRTTVNQNTGSYDHTQTGTKINPEQVDQIIKAIIAIPSPKKEYKERADVVE